MTIEPDGQGQQAAPARADIAAVRDGVQQVLLQLFGGAEVDSDGDFCFRHKDVPVWVSVKPFHEANTAVKVFAVLCIGAPPSAELFRHVAIHGTYVFGNLRCSEEDGKVAVTLGHSLLGEGLDPGQLKVALFMVAGIGNEIAADLCSRFGGRTYYDD